jgi:hypothetical protein
MLKAPTAMQKVAETHDTPAKSVMHPAPVHLGGLGLGWIVHFVPFQPSMSGASVGFERMPTASHEVVDTHDTLEKASSLP